jgi:uncharacterized protein YdeI (YjbR/CyaY-like superfamily)
MEVTETLYAKNRKEWRSWLSKNHKKADEIWLIYYKKGSGKPRIPYNDAVEEALCYGWIDSTMKKLDDNRYAQRFSPRRKNSNLSELNKERVRRLIKSGKMTKAGLEKIKHHLEGWAEGAGDPPTLNKFEIPDDILVQLKADPVIWRNFRKFPEHYKMIRIGWINGARKRPNEFKKRLRYFMKMTAKNKRYGMVR